MSHRQMCDGRDWCSPDEMPTSPEETMVCPDCGRHYEAFLLTPESTRMGEELFARSFSGRGPRYGWRGEGYR